MAVLGRLRTAALKKGITLQRGIKLVFSKKLASEGRQEGDENS